MEISRDRITCKLWLSQENYILKMLKRFNIADARPVTTLAGHLLSSGQSKLTRRGGWDVSSTICECGGITNACTRLDLAYAVSKVSRFMSNSCKQHWEVVKWVLRYLRWTSRLGLAFQRLEKGSLSCYRDMLMQIMQEILISEDLWRVMYSQYLSTLLVGRRVARYRGSFNRWGRVHDCSRGKACGWEDWSVHLASYRIQF